MSTPRLMSLPVLGVVMLLMLPGTAQADPPTCVGGEFLIGPGEQIPFPDEPCTDPEGDPYQLEITTLPHKGTVTMTEYTAFPGAHGYDEFSYRAVVSETEASLPATVTILIDRFPTCTDATAATQSGVALVLPEFPCQDADGDMLTILLADPQHGTIDISSDGMTVTYTPPAGFTGTDQLLFAAEEYDYGVLSAPATLTITVTAAAPPAPPVTPSSQQRPAAPADLSAPRLTMRSRSTRLGNALSAGLPLRLTLSEDARASIRVTVSRKTARKLGIRRPRQGQVRIGGRSVALRAGNADIRVPLTAKARRALRSARRVTLQVSVAVTDRAGNRDSRTLTIKLRR
jgi:Bacterial Ig domain